MAQKHSAAYKESLTSNEVVNYKDYHSKNTGVYEGFVASKVSDTSVQIGAGVLFIDSSDSKVTVKVEEDDAQTITTSSTLPFIVCQFTYAQTSSNAPKIIAKSEASLLDTDVIIVKCVYSGSTLQSFDYSFRSFGNLKDETIRLDPTTNSDYVYIMPSTNFWYINNTQTNIKYVNERIKKNYVNITSLVTGTNNYIVATVSGSTVSYSAVQASSSNIPTYSFTRQGWYLSGVDVDKRVLCQFEYVTGNPAVITALFDQDYSYESRNVTLGVTGIESVPSDSRISTQKAIYSYLENKGLGDNSTAKNINNIDWDAIYTYGTGLFFVLAETQTGTSPDGSTNSTWAVYINKKGNSGTGINLAYQVMAYRVPANSAQTEVKAYTKSYLAYGDVSTGWKSLFGSRSSTLVVAASNTSSASKSSADYVCDGINDEVEIQAAIDYLSAGGGYGLGGTVQLTEGTFYINNSIVCKDLVSVVGRGEDATIISPYETSIVNNLVNYFTYSGILTSGKMEKFSIDGKGYTHSNLSEVVNGYGNAVKFFYEYICIKHIIISSAAFHPSIFRGVRNIRFTRIHNIEAINSIHTVSLIVGFNNCYYVFDNSISDMIGGSSIVYGFNQSLGVRNNGIGTLTGGAGTVGYKECSASITSGAYKITQTGATGNDTPVYGWNVGTAASW